MPPKNDLERLRLVLEQPEQILELVSKSLAEETINLIKDGFRAETDPYGQRWEPKQKPDGRKTLSGQTGRLKTGWKVTNRTQDEIRVSPSVEYAEYHQNPQARRRASASEALRAAARGIDTGRRRSTFSVDTIGPARLSRPRRMMVPDSSLGMPPTWNRQLEETATEAMETILGGKRGVSALSKLLTRQAGLKAG